MRLSDDALETLQRIFLAVIAQQNDEDAAVFLCLTSDRGAAKPVQYQGLGSEFSHIFCVRCCREESAGRPRLALLGVKERHARPPQLQRVPCSKAPSGSLARRRRTI